MAHPCHPPACSVCNDPAVYFNREDGTHLCSTHFCRSVEEQFQRTILAENMVPPGSRVAVALSGGKDSSVLLHLLHTVQCSPGETGLVALTVDEGITGYRDETMKSASDLCRRLGVPQVTLSFADRFGSTLDRLLTGREDRACSFCGTLRKRLLEEGARATGAAVIATGHCLDDEVQAAAMNVLRGDSSRITRELPGRGSASFVPRVKPLSRITEREVALYAVLTGLYRDLPECPYARYALRGEIRDMLNTLEKDRPGTMRLMIQNYAHFRACLKKKSGAVPLGTCRQCGAPSSGTICRVCALVGKTDVRDNPEDSIPDP